jgi:hypothetical protein
LSDVLTQPAQTIPGSGEDVPGIVEKSDGFSGRRYASAKSSFPFPERRNRHVVKVSEGGRAGGSVTEVRQSVPAEQPQAEAEARERVVAAKRLHGVSVTVQTQ